MWGQLNQTYLDLNDSIPDQDSLTWTERKRILIVSQKKSDITKLLFLSWRITFTFRVWSCCYYALGWLESQYINKFKDSSILPGLHHCVLCKRVTTEKVSTVFRTFLVSNKVIQFILFTHRKKAKSAQKNPHLSVLKCIGVLPGQSPSEWMLVHSVFYFPGILLFQVTHVKSMSYFRLAQVLNFTQFINAVQSLSNCCDNSLVSRGPRGQGGKKHLIYIHKIFSIFISAFLFFITQRKETSTLWFISSTK